ncbi:DUF4336 domain-containing protein [Pseudoalteromonas sp. T1lg23B]|uniref:DUF4336 domain-containing protein n=1 Tax=Pseudoalteromonas sp. T1lg23B TaxID=2077097 RepID=UPI000CF601F6|nr:DUF4336 domain-containing protein [Pseudoalteromonas sp. T1lg23B]
MKKIADNIWVFDGQSVSYFSLPHATRMTVVRFADNSLWLHSPIKMTDVILREVSSLGEVKYLIAPNELHHLYLHDWQQQFPEAMLMGTAQVARKRFDLAFNSLLSEDFLPPWPDDITYLLFTGSPAMEEAVFFHRPSRTLIVTDLIEGNANVGCEPSKNWLAKFAGVVAPDSGAFLDWRLSFTFHKEEARRHIEQMLSWHPRIIIMAHSQEVDHHAPLFLERAFSWLHPHVTEQAHANN